MRRTGVRLRAFASRWFSDRTMAHVIDPVLADLQAEFEEALHHGKVWRSRWVWVAGHIALVKAVSCYGAISTMRVLAEASEDGHALRRTLGCSLVSAGLVAVALVASDLRKIVPPDHPNPGTLAFLWMPSVVPISLAAGLLLGIIWGMGRGPASWRSRAFLLLVAVLWSTVSFVMLAWVVPQTNQAYRVAVFGAPLPKGAHELSIGELRRSIDGAGRSVPADARPDDVRRLTLVYHGRSAIAAMPVAFALFGFALANRRWRRRLAPLVASGAAIAGYIVLQRAVTMSFANAPAAAVAWTPNLVLLGVSCALRALRSPNPADRQASA
jgi:hypothetical protein